MTFVEVQNKRKFFKKKVINAIISTPILQTKYYIYFQEKVNLVSDHIHKLPKTEGLVPIFINAQTGQWRAHSTITLGARGDTYYEYLLKQWIQTGRTRDLYVVRLQFEL